MSDTNINLIKWQKHNNGLYFGYFDNKEDAFEYLKKLKNKYLYSYKRKYTIKELCEEAGKDGVVLYQQNLSRWFKLIWDVNVKRNAGDRKKNKRRDTVTLDKEVYHIFQQFVSRGAIAYHMKSWYINKMLRFFLGLPNEEVLILFEDELDLFGCLFFEKNTEVRALYVGNPQTGTRKLIESLCSDAETNGMGFIKTKARTLGYYALGADE